MSALRGKKLDPEGKKHGVQTGRSQFCGKQNEHRGSSSTAKGGKK